jgi:hypothetical protein
LKILAGKIAQQLKARDFCLVFATELERCWPSDRLDRGEREKQIEAFAKSYGWSASVLDIDAQISEEIPNIADYCSTHRCKD